MVLRARLNTGTCANFRNHRIRGEGCHYMLHMLRLKVAGRLWYKRNAIYSQGEGMKLSTVHVTNFRSVEDSTEFEVGQVTCLVGKNEAGKTAIEQALAGLNPHTSTPVGFDLERDYPRRWLTEYEDRHGKEHGAVITTKWVMSPEEKAGIAEKIGKSAILDQPVKVLRRYMDSEPQWSLPINFKKAIENLTVMEKLDEEERQPIVDADTSSKLVARLEGLKERTPKQQRLLDRVKGYPNSTISGAVMQSLLPGLPRFLYSSHYDRMVGEIRLDTFNARKQGQQQPAIQVGEQIFLDFLEYAGTSLEEIIAAKTYEGLMLGVKRLQTVLRTNCRNIGRRTLP